MTDALIAAHGEVDKLMPYLHLPVQSGSDRILKAMNRSHTADSYLRIIERVRAARPDIAISGDFIVGFPGETEADFEATLTHRRRGRLRSAYSFKYRARPGTPAAAMEDQVPREVMDERLQRLQALINAQAASPSTSEGRPRHADPDRAQGPPCRPDDRQVALAAVGACRDRRRDRRHDRRDRALAPAPTAWPAPSSQKVAA